MNTFSTIQTNIHLNKCQNALKLVFMDLICSVMMLFEAMDQLISHRLLVRIIEE